MALPNVIPVSTMFADIPLNSNITGTGVYTKFFKFTTLDSTLIGVNLFQGVAASSTIAIYNKFGEKLSSNQSTSANAYFVDGNGRYMLHHADDYYLGVENAGTTNSSVQLFVDGQTASVFTPVYDKSFVAPIIPVSYSQSQLDVAVATALVGTYSGTDYQTVVSARDMALADKVTVEAARDTALADKAAALTDLATVTTARDTALADKTAALTDLATVTIARDTALAEKATVEAALVTASSKFSTDFAIADNYALGLSIQLSTVTAARDAAIADKSIVEAARDAAIADKAAGLQGVVSNLDGVAISAGAVNFSKIKSNYTAFDFDKTINANLLANKIVTSVNSTKVTAGDGNDTVTASAGNDTLDGGKGDDVISAGDGNNVVTAGAGSDSITAGVGNDKIDVGDGNDTVSAWVGGNDTILGGKGDDSITAGVGNDKIDASDGNDTVNAGYGNNTVVGGKGDDFITSGYGADSLDGGDGNDVISSSGANSKLLAGNGDDLLTLSFLSEPDGVLSKDTLDGGAGNDVLTNFGLDGFHKMNGGAGNDQLLHFSIGSATIDGGAGNDYLATSSLSDVLTGGADSDIFDLTNTYQNGSVKITDFKTGVDKIFVCLSGAEGSMSLFSLVSSANSVSGFQFQSGKGLIAQTTADAHFVYNSTNGALFYDADGSGVVSQTVQIALIANKVGIVASDILI